MNTVVGGNPDSWPFQVPAPPAKGFFIARANSAVRPAKKLQEFAQHGKIGRRILRPPAAFGSRPASSWRHSSGTNPRRCIMQILCSRSLRSPSRRRFFGGRIPLALCIVLAWVEAAPAQLPVTRLSGVFPPGGRQGESVEITISGTDLDSVDRLMFSHPGIVARPKLRDPAEFETAPQPVPNQFQIAVGADVPPGIYELRAVGKYGVSNPRAFAVG